MEKASEQSAFLKNLEYMSKDNLSKEEMADFEANTANLRLGEGNVTEQFSCIEALHEFIHSDEFGPQAKYHISTLARYVDLRKVIGEMAKETVSGNTEKLRGIINDTKGMQDVPQRTRENIIAHLQYFYAERVGASLLTGVLIGQFLAQNEHKLDLIKTNSEEAKDE